MEAFRKVKITRIRELMSEETEDSVALEKKVRISVNGKHALSLYCTPLMVREFVAGVVHNEGLISGQWCAERMSIEFGDEILVDIPSEGTLVEGERTITSGCAGGVTFSRESQDNRISDQSVFRAETLRTLYRGFQKRSEGYRLTGGVHSAALADEERILVFAEDIGRHNAVDKIIGHCLLEHLSFEGKIMLASGRLSSEIVSKCSRCRIPVLVSRAAPTTLAVELAEASGMTLIGFMRGDRMNVYTGGNRIVLH